MVQVLRINQVIERVGMRRSWIYQQIGKGDFPAGFKIGSRSRGWTVDSIEAWVAQRVGAK